MNNNDLQEALYLVAYHARKQHVFWDRPELSDANEAAIQLFGSRDPILRPVEPGGRVKNITALSIFRVRRYMKLRGIDLPLVDWDSVVRWLTENWDKILRVLLGLLSLIFML